jgi:hypothetical protein
VPFQNKDPSAIDVVQFILESCLLRRDKTMRDVDGQMIVELPPKTVEFEYLKFSESERKVYDQLYTAIKRQYLGYSKGSCFDHLVARVRLADLALPRNHQPARSARISAKSSPFL